MAELKDLTHEQLDALAESEGVDPDAYPSSGNKDAKVDALSTAGVQAPEGGPADDTATSAPEAPTAPEDPRAEAVREAVNEGRTGLDPALARQRKDARKAERNVRPVRTGSRTVDVVDPDGRFDRAREKALKAEGQTQDVREGPVDTEG